MGLSSFLATILYIFAIPFNKSLRPDREERSIIVIPKEPTEFAPDLRRETYRITQQNPLNRPLIETADRRKTREYLFRLYGREIYLSSRLRLSLKNGFFQRKKLQIYYSLPLNPIINTVQQKVNSLKLYNLIPSVSKVQVFSVQFK